jgi:hypothetical protein
VNVPSSPVYFREVQRWRDVWWVMVLVFGLAAIQWYGFIQQIVLGQPFGNKPGPDWLVMLIWLLFGIGMPIFFFNMRLVVEVNRESVVIGYRPLTTRSISMNSISEVEAREYQPLREFGGWGIRGGNRRIVYNVSGNRGVDITLVDGRKVLIGSQRAEDLARTIIALRSGLG